MLPLPARQRRDRLVNCSVQVINSGSLHQWWNCWHADKLCFYSVTLLVIIMKLLVFKRDVMIWCPSYRGHWPTFKCDVVGLWCNCWHQWRGKDFSTWWSSVVCDPTFSIWGCGGHCISPPSGPGWEPRRQTHFGNNCLKINWKSGLWVTVYTPNSDPISSVHWLVGPTALRQWCPRLW